MVIIGLTRGQRYTLVALVALLLVVLSMSTGVAAEPSINAATAYNGVLDMYKQMAGRWESAIKTVARGLFGSLFLLEIVWVGIQAMLRKADLAEFFSDLIKLVMFFGFYFALMTWSGEWAAAIIDGLRKVAAIATATGGYPATMSPGDVLLSGLVVTGKLSDSMSILPWKALANGGIALAAIVIIAAFSSIAAFMAVVIVESYVIVGASTIFMAFGGSRWTVEYARRTLTYVLSVGAKLMMMQLLVGGGMQLIKEWQARFKADESSTFALIGIILLLAILVLKLPDLMQSMLNGVSAGGSGIGALAGVAATAAAGVAGAGAAVGAASNLAKMQAGAGGAASSLANAVGSAASGFGSSMGGGGAGAVGSAGKSASSSASTVAGPMSGRGEAGTGSISGAGFTSPSPASGGSRTAGPTPEAGPTSSPTHGGTNSASNDDSAQSAAGAGDTHSASETAGEGSDGLGSSAAGEAPSAGTPGSSGVGSGEPAAASSASTPKRPQTTRDVVATSLAHSMRVVANLGTASLRHMGQRGMGHRVADELTAKAERMQKPTL